MDVNNLIDIYTREELYAWYLENHDKVSDFWLRVNRAREPYPGVVGYVDAVEVALCFGWIDSTQKRIDDGKPIQHFTPRSKRSNWCRHNIERCRRLIDIGEMTPAGLAVLPDINPDHFVFEQWVTDALTVDPIVWKNFNSFPGADQRIKVDRIQHYNSTKRPEYAMHMLQTLIDDTRKGKMQPGWDDGGKLLEDYSMYHCQKKPTCGF